MTPESPEKTGIVLQIEAKGDSFLSLSFLSREAGLETFLLRRSRRKARPDLFDTASVRFGARKQTGPTFAEEYRVLCRRSGIGKSFPRVQTASRFANFLRENAQHLADPHSVFPLCNRFFDAVSAGVDSSAAYLKALYLFASNEGFPLKEDWGRSLPEEAARDLGTILKTPLGRQETAEEQILALSRSLETWLVREAHFVIDPGSGNRP